MGEWTRRAGVRASIASMCVAYPWLHAGAAGPSPAVEPMLVAGACVALVLIAFRLGDGAHVPRGMVIAPLAFMLALWLGDAIARGSPALSPAVAAACIVIAGIALCAIWTHAMAAQTGAVAAWLAWGWLIAGLASTVIALAQLAGIESVFGSWAASSPLHHAFGNLRQRNHYATLVTIALASLAWLAPRARTRVLRAAALASALLLCAGLAASGSRTGLLAFAAVVVLWAAWHRDRPQARWAFALAACYVACALAFLLAGGSGAQGVMARILGDAPDCQGRRVLWATMADLALQRPWGWGWHELPYATYAAGTQPAFCALVENAHDLPLHLAVELGVPVAVAFCLVCIVALAKLRPWRESSDARQLGWTVIAVLAIHSLLEYPLWYGPFQMALGFSLGMVWSGARSWQLPRMRMMAAGFAWLGCVAFVAFDYARVSQPYLDVQARWPAFAQDPLAQARRSWLFRDQAIYGELMSTPLTPQTAAQVFALSQDAMHFAPEPRVIERKIASARLLRRDEDAAAEARRYARSYPDAYAAWSSRR